MARPTIKRKVCCMPRNDGFMPMNPKKREKEVIILTIDEYETIRLIDYVGLSQKECSESMKVARTTVQRIYQKARKKVAQALVEGRPFTIEGGDYKICSGKGKACRHKGCQGRS